MAAENDPSFDAPGTEDPSLFGRGTYAYGSPSPTRRSLLDSDNPVLSLLGGIFSGGRIDPNADINSPVQQRTALDSLLAAGATIANAGGARFGPQPTLAQGLTQGLVAGTMAGQAAQEHAQTLAQTQQVLAQSTADAEVRRRLMERLIRNGDIAANLITGELGARQQPAAAPAGAPATGTPGDGVREALKQREQGRDGYMSVNGLGFSGAYQIGSELAGAAGFYVPPQGGEGRNGWGGRFNIPGFSNVQTREDFLRNPAAQDQAYSLAMAHNDKVLQERGIYDRALAKGTIGGVPITRDGLLAGAWIGGVEGLERWVDSDGKVNAADRNRTSVGDYVRLGSGGAAQPAGAPAARPAAAAAAAPSGIFDAPGVEMPPPGAAPAQAGSGGGKVVGVLERYPGSTQLAANVGGTVSDVPGGAAGVTLPATPDASPFDTANIPLPAAASAAAAPAAAAPAAAAPPAPTGQTSLPPAPQRMLQRATTAQLAGVLLSKDPTKALLDLANQKAERTTGVDPEGNAREAILDNNGNIVGWGLRKPFAGHTVKSVDPATGMINEYRLNDAGQRVGEPIGQMKPEYRYQTEVIDGQTWHTERVPGTDIMRKLAPAPRDIKQVKEWDDATKRTLIWNLDANGNKQGTPFVSNEVPSHVTVAVNGQNKLAYIYPGQPPVPVADAGLLPNQVDIPPSRRRGDIEEAGATEGAKEANKLAAQESDAIYKGRSKAQGMTTQLNMLEAAADRIPTGPGIESAVQLGKLATQAGINLKALGLPFAESTAVNTDVFRKIANGLVLGQLGADGMPRQAFSDRDLQFLEQTMPGLQNLPGANKAIVNYMRAIQGRAVDYANAWHTWRQTNGSGEMSMRNFQSEWGDRIANDPLVAYVSDPADVKALPPNRVWWTDKAGGMMDYTDPRPPERRPAGVRR